VRASSCTSWLLAILRLASSGEPGFAQASKEDFDPVAFGAKADGKTDDTAAIRKALDAAGKLGGVVRLPAGEYTVYFRKNPWWYRYCHQLIIFASTNAAVAASPPTTTVCHALRSGFFTVNRPLMYPKTRRASKVTITETIRAEWIDRRKK